MVAAGFSYFTKNKLYIWERRKNKTDRGRQNVALNGEEQRENLEKEVRLSGSKLRDLAWSLDVLDLKK